MDLVFELAHVARPVVRLQHGDGVLADAPRGEPGEPQREMARMSTMGSTWSSSTMQRTPLAISARAPTSRPRSPVSRPLMLLFEPSRIVSELVVLSRCAIRRCSLALQACTCAWPASLRSVCSISRSSALKSNFAAPLIPKARAMSRRVASGFSSIHWRIASLVGNSAMGAELAQGDARVTPRVHKGRTMSRCGMPASSNTGP